MGLTWEKIKRSLGIPDKLTDAEAGDEQTTPEFTGRNQPQIESGPFGAIPAQEGPREFSGIPEAVLDNASYSESYAQEVGEIGGGGLRRGDREAERMSDDARHGDDGVYVLPTPITLGEAVQVMYTGPLTDGDPHTLHLHWGFGPGRWTHVQDVAMKRDGDGYTASLNVDKDGRFEFCFHDNQGNWDNNEGRNWSYIVHDGALPGEYVVD